MRITKNGINENQRHTYSYKYSCAHIKYVFKISFSRVHLRFLAFRLFMHIQIEIDTSIVRNISCTIVDWFEKATDTDTNSIRR